MTTSARRGILFDITARPIRVEFPDAVYRVTARGHERRPIFRDDTDRRCFLESAEQMVRNFSVVLHAYCLMPNHYHLLIQTPRANLSAANGWLQTTCSLRFNRRHQRCGTLFQERYKAHLVDKNTYAATLIKYIHPNPVQSVENKTLPLKAKKKLAEYPWSSHRAYTGDNRESPAGLCLDWLGYLGATFSLARTRVQETNRPDVRRRFSPPGRTCARAWSWVVKNPGKRFAILFPDQEEKKKFA